MPTRQLGPSARYRQPLEVAAVAVVSGPAMLWGRRLDDGSWTTPAGHLEPGEDPSSGAVRELWEEAGIRATPAALRSLGARRSGKHLVHCFRLDLPEQAEATSDHDPDEEVGEWRWTALEDGKLPGEIASNLHVPPNRNALLHALGLAKAEAPGVRPLGAYHAAGEEAVVRPHPVGRGLQVVWFDELGEMGRTGALSKSEMQLAIGQWLAKAGEGGDPPALPAGPTPTPTPKKPRAPRAPKAPKPEPEKNLVVQHNISERGLANAHKLGGLPAPSLAIAHKDNPLIGFGEISLVAHPSMVDPKAKVPLFDSDVYSPRYPRAKRRINERAARQLEQELRPHLEETNRIGYRSLDAHDVARDLEREQPEDFAEKRNGATAALGLAYLRSKGEKVELPPEGPPEMVDVLGHYNWGHRLKNLQGIHLPEDRDQRLDLETQKKIVDEASRAIEEHTQEEVAGRGLTPEQIDRKIGIRKQAAELGEMVEGQFVPYSTDEPMDRESIRKILSDANNIGKKVPRTGPAREARMANMVHERVKDDPGFKQYLRDKLGPLQGEEYIEVGESGRKVPHTMDNVLRVLTSKIRGGEESAFGGLGQVRAAGSKQFRSLDQAKQEGGRLVSKQKMEEAKKENEEHFGRLVSELTPHHGYYKDSKNFGQYDHVAGVVQDFLKLKSVDRALAASGYKPGDVPEPVKAQIRQFAQELTTMPTEYFEAKPQRAVGLREFRGAAVPHDASPETLEVLRHHGLQVEPYQRGDEEGRKRAIQKLTREHDLMLSELSKSEGGAQRPPLDPVSSAMRHPDPVERALALKSSGTRRHHLAAALVSGDSVLVAAALAHPSLDAETIGVLAGSSGRWAEKRALLARPDLTPVHLEAMTRSALGG